MTSWVDNEALVDDEEREQTPMSDADHARLFGWAWDDPARADS